VVERGAAGFSEPELLHAIQRSETRSGTQAAMAG
jgi:hypothetical protein